MKHQWTTLLIGFILMVLPFLGFPYTFKYTVMFLAGLFFFARAFLALKHHYGSEADAYVAQSRSSTASTESLEEQIPSVTDTYNTPSI